MGSNKVPRALIPGISIISLGVMGRLRYPIR
jgi:hypothetical protein